MQETVKIRHFTELVAWQKAHQLCIEIYKITASFPQTERFGLIVQIRRASVSITSNIAEGFGRRTQSDKNRFYDMAIGSLNEVQNQLFLSRDLCYLSTDMFSKLYSKSIVVHKIINSLIQ